MQNYLKVLTMTSGGFVLSETFTIGAINMHPSHFSGPKTDSFKNGLVINQLKNTLIRIYHIYHIRDTETCFGNGLLHKSSGSSYKFRS